MINLFIQQLAVNPFFYATVVLSVIISIVLHELAHGWMAIRKGDQTPLWQGRMTGNPFIHMGGFSLFVLLFFGLAWGQMPIDPTRMRGKYAEAWVAVAGPAMNLLLAIITLGGLVVWLRWGYVDAENDIHANAVFLLWIFGTMNVFLCVFNLFPVTPLDGSHILANFNQRYANFIYSAENQTILMFGFFMAFAVAGVLFGKIMGWVMELIFYLSGDGVSPFAQIYMSRMGR